MSAFVDARLGWAMFLLVSRYVYIYIYIYTCIYVFVEDGQWLPLLDMV